MLKPVFCQIQLMRYAYESHSCLHGDFGAHNNMTRSITLSLAHAHGVITTAKHVAHKSGRLFVVFKTHMHLLINTVRT